MSDAELCDEDAALAEAKLGKALAFASLVRAHQASVYSLALRIARDRENARDLAQEAFLQLYRKLATIESARHLKFWLRKVTVNLAIDRMRQHPKVEFAPLDEDVPVYEHSSEESLLPTQLLKFVCELPPGARAVMLLKYQEDLDPSEIADALEMSVNTVKSHIRRSLLVIRERVLGAGPAAAMERTR